MRKYLPSPEAFVGGTLPHNPSFLIKEHVGSGNNGHVFRAYSDTTGHELACKIVPPRNLPRTEKDQNLWLQEAKKSNELTHPAVVRCIDVDLLGFPDSDEPYVVFLYEYVSGKSLREYLKKKQITITFIETFLQVMLGLLHELSGRGIEHGDLHAGNVIVADPSDLDIEPRTSFRVIDFGVREVSGLAGDKRDALGVAHMLRDMLEAVDYQAAHPRDKYVYNVIRDDFLGRHLIETNPLANGVPSGPKAMYDRLQRIDVEYAEKQASEQATKMLTPFDYPNCEQMGHSHLLLNSLYSRRFLGLREIEARNNLVLTGPRGCGKTTVFRALSLRHRLVVRNDAPEDLVYIGVYYRCDDLYFAFPRYVRPERNEALDVPMHFVVVTLMAELLGVVFVGTGPHGISRTSLVDGNGMLRRSCGSCSDGNRRRTQADLVWTGLRIACGENGVGRCIRRESHMTRSTHSECTLGRTCWLGRVNVFGMSLRLYGICPSTILWMTTRIQRSLKTCRKT